MSAPPAVVAIRDLTLRIPTRVGRRVGYVHAATEVSLQLRPGRLHAVVGESGCGKSILAAALVGLLPERTIVRGAVRIAAHDVSHVLDRPDDPTWRELRGRVVGLVPQSSATFLTPTRTVGAQLAETVRWLGGPDSPDDLLERVALDRRCLAAYPHQLSGGMSSRAALAFALAGRPAVLVADEPTAGLDDRLTGHVLALLRSLADEGTAVLLITHDLGRLLDGEIADELSVQYAGRIEETGSASEILRGGRTPYTRALLAALPRNGLHAVPGMPPTLTDLDPSVTFADRLAQASV